MRDAFDVIVPGAHVRLIGLPTSEQMDMLDEAKPAGSERIGLASDLHSDKVLFDSACEVIFRHNRCDRAVFVGDMIDREANPEHSILILQAIHSLGKKAVYLAGNHERDILMQILAPDLWEEHREEYGFDEKYELADMLKENRFLHLLTMLRSLPLYFENDDVFAVHSGLVDSSIKKTKQTLDAITKDPKNQGYCVAPILSIAGRTDQEEKATDSDKMIVTGHWHRPVDAFDHMVGFNDRLRLGHRPGLIHVHTVCGNQQTYVKIAK